MKVFSQIILFGIAFIGMLGVGEIFIRITHIGNVSPTEFYDDIGRGRRKDLNYLYFNEGFGIGKYNEYRYCGESNPPKKPANTIRIALLGDSFIESYQVFERDYFGTIAEKLLSQKYEKLHFEILNFGRAGFDISDMYVYQNTFVEEFNPDYIFYMVSTADLVPKYSDVLRPKTLIQDGNLTISKEYSTSEINIFLRIDLPSVSGR